MKTMNENGSVMSSVKAKTAEILARALVTHAEQGVKESFAFFVSEPKIPIELMEKDSQ